MNSQSERKQRREETKMAAAQPEVQVESGKKQYLIASRRGFASLGAGLMPMSANEMRSVVGSIPGLNVIRVLKPQRGLTPLSVRADEAQETYVVQMETERAN